MIVLNIAPFVEHWIHCCGNKLSFLEDKPISYSFLPLVICQIWNKTDLFDKKETQNNQKVSATDRGLLKQTQLEAVHDGPCRLGLDH